MENINVNISDLKEVRKMSEKSLEECEKKSAKENSLLTLENNLETDSNAI